MKAVASGLALSVVLLTVSVPVHAQTIVRGMGVADRSRPDYDPIGLGVESFQLYPSLTVRGDATDNYRATNSNRLSDVYMTIEPELRIASNWSRNRLNGRLYYDQSVHANLPSENVGQYGVEGDGVIDVTRRSVLNGDFSIGHFVESRASLGSFQNSSEPVTYDAYHVAAGAAQEFNRLKLTASVGENYTDFHDVAGPNGTTVDQDYRDYRTLSGTASGTYDVGAGVGIIITGTADRSRYSFGPGSAGYDPLVNIDRDSSGYTILGGVTFELSSLIFGRIQIGLLNQNYTDPRLQDFSGFSYDANVLWNVTPLTSLRFRAARSIDQTSSTTIAGNVRSDFAAGVDHELFRYVILSADARYDSFQPNGPGIGGKEYGLNGTARYLLDRHWSAAFNAGYNGRTSSSTSLRYHAAVVGLSAKYAY